MDQNMSQLSQQTMEQIQEQIAETTEQLKRFKKQAYGVQVTNIKQAINSLDNAASQLRQVPPSI